MHVRYLQHQYQDSLQRLTTSIPYTTTIDSIGSKIRSMDQPCSANNDESELESIPLPIQTFLWRQTNPFLGAKIGKLHEASCVTFERVVVQNILHGLSPSLSDAIGSVPRWRFIRAAFPHIVQCCASLLSEASNRNDAPISGSLVKILYILHWLLLDAANECYDVEGRKSLADATDLPVHAIQQFAFSISSIQLFVYMITPLLNVINENDLTSNFRLESGLKIWQSLWQHRQPDVLCFCAPVKQRRIQFPFITITKKTRQFSAVQGIYLGDIDDTMTRRLSNVPTQIANLTPYTNIQPRRKPSRLFLKVLSTLNKPNENEKNEISTIHTTITSDINSQKQQQQFSSKKMEESSSIIRSISDYHNNHKNDIARSVPKCHTTVFDRRSPIYDHGMTEIENALKFTDDKSLSNEMNVEDDNAGLSTKQAPLVVLQEICSGISPENVSQSGHEIICKNCHSVMYCNDSVIYSCKCNNHSVAPCSKLNNPAISTNYSNNALPEFKQNIDESSNIESITKLTDSLENKSGEEYDIDSIQQNQQQQSFADPQEATYMDVAVIRCLLIKHWAESGVYWALKYLLHRLFEIKIYRNLQTNTLRANSVPNISQLKRNENRKFLKERQYRPAIWDDMQLGNIAKKLEKCKHDEKVLSILFKKNRRSLSSDSLLQTMALARRNDMMASRNLVKNSNKRGNLERERSYQSATSATNLSDGLSTTDTRSGSVTGLPKQQNTDQLYTPKFFPEALGSTNFIKQNGQISFNVLLKAVKFVIERRSTVRIYELVLNICESLLEMPETELQSFFNDCIDIVLRIYLWLGCLHGCNDGLRSQQANFLRIKARTILAIISRSDPKFFHNSLISHIEEYNAQMLIDTLHSITGFCRCDIAGIHRTRSSSSPNRRAAVSDTSIPSYKNNFNESLKGIEGTVIKFILKPMVSKLMNAMNELLQPENMSLYQDVRLFVTFIQEKHGNSFRRVGLSALLDGQPSENQSQFIDVSMSQQYFSRRASLLCPLPEIFLPERNLKVANNDGNE